MARIEQRYQGSFTLHAKKSTGGDLVRKIQKVIYAWIVKSERCLYGQSGCHLNKEFNERSKFVSLKPGVSNVATNVFYSDSDAAWCMRYVHDDSTHKGIDWVTECGLRLEKATDEVIFPLCSLQRLQESIYLTLQKKFAGKSPSLASLKWF